MKTKKYTCLQMTNTAIRLVEMIRNDGRWKRVRSDSRSLPETVSNPLSHPTLVGTLRDLLSGVKSRSQKVFVSISSDEVLFKWIQLPAAIPQTSVKMQNLAIETALEIENYIPVSLDAAAYDFHLMNPTSLLVGWMRKKRLASISEQLATAGVELAYLTPHPVVLANQLLSEWDTLERVGGIHINGNLCDLAVIEDGAAYCGRSVFVKNPAQLWEAVRQTFATCPNPKGTPLKRIVLFQGDAELPTNPEALTEQLGVEVIPSTFDWTQALLAPIAQTEGINLNLLTPMLAENAAQQKRRRKRLLIRLIPIAAVLLLLGANMVLFDVVESKRERINALRLDRAQVKMLQTETKSLQKQHATLETALAQLAWGERQFSPLAGRLVQIANQLPDTVRLTEIKTVPPPRGAAAYAAFDARQTLLVVGVALTQTEIDAYRVALVRQLAFASVRQIKTEPTIISGEKWLTFTLSLTSVEGGALR